MIVDGLAKGLAKDAADLALRKISVALSWPVNRLNVTLSLRGSPEDIQTVLSSLLTVIDPLKAPSMRILVKLATNNASKLAGDNASTCPLQKELQAES